MSALLLDGTKIAAEIKTEVGAEAKALINAGVRPGLAAVLVGNDPASEVYVRSKVRACEALGFFSEHIVRPDTLTTADVLALVEELNARDDVDGILVQLPLPKAVDARTVLLSIDPQKDVDGLHPVSVGNLSANHPTLVACTPAGVMEILRRSNIPVAGKEAVVVGRSDIVGKPMAMLLLHQNATVTICHSRTRNLPEITSKADIIVAAIGRPGFIRAEHIGEGSTVIDVGINNVSDPAAARELFGEDEIGKRLATIEKRGFTLVGDVNPKEAIEKAANFTPVPGGIGLLTVAMLMKNTIAAAKIRRKLD